MIIPLNSPTPADTVSSHYEPVDSSTGRKALYDGLTARQENFCRYVANGCTNVSAYTQAFGVTDEQDKQSVYNRVHALQRKPEIRQRIDHLLTEKEQIAVNDYAVLRRFVIERLQIEALNDNNGGAARIRALELLGKMDKIQLFSDRPVKEEKPLNRKDLTAELESRLTKILASRTIEIGSGGN